MAKLLGIHGKPRSGKDTVADYLVANYGFTKFGPSFPVKATTAAMFDVPLECFYDQNIKENIDPFWGISYREMAQKVGKESSRDVFFEDIWMRHVEKKLNENLNIVMGDIRYANEAEWVRNHGGKVLFITRNDYFRGYVANAGHAAEQGLPSNLANGSIQNDGSLEELFLNVDWLMNSWFGEQNENKR